MQFLTPPLAALVTLVTPPHEFRTSLGVADTAHTTLFPTDSMGTLPLQVQCTVVTTSSRYLYLAASLCPLRTWVRNSCHPLCHLLQGGRGQGGGKPLPPYFWLASVSCQSNKFKVILAPCTLPGTLGKVSIRLISTRQGSWKPWLQPAQRSVEVSPRSTKYLFSQTPQVSGR